MVLPYKTPLLTAARDWGSGVVFCRVKWMKITLDLVTNPKVVEINTKVFLMLNLS
jgi:hypothetical protein